MEKNLAEYGDILRPEDVQKILHVGRNTVYRYLAEGTIK
jgi:predicted site-specific integrase-resolvase